MANLTYLGQGDRSLRQAQEGGPSDDEEFIDMRIPTPTTKYRDTTVGKLLAETLDELLANNKISPELYHKTLCQFDRSILNALSQRSTSRVTFKGEKLSTYRFLDGTWTFILNHVEFRDYYNLANVSKVKVLAFDGRVAVPKARSGNTKKRWRGGQGQQQAK